MAKFKAVAPKDDDERRQRNLAAQAAIAAIHAANPCPSYTRAVEDKSGPAGDD